MLARGLFCSTRGLNSKSAVAQGDGDLLSAIRAAETAVVGVDEDVPPAFGALLLITRIEIPFLGAPAGIALERVADVLY